MKDKKLVVKVMVEMHVSYRAEPGREAALLKDIKHASQGVPFEQITAGVNGSYSMVRKINRKHKQR